ncbi:hypothetical protein ACPOL_1097 [Acidisarcina polymorpha]|uniref:DUF1634 domain-containing protein n=1 Tax=Acidisarcina polymorpha TaxID=2211140 RepID=A0A2Z5FUC1_9BACT|nr:DUF1634 domain-containing protein [Acidisarcina polymorpha]AXC10448.1 hypothetical protein ACPOL_1097 [Acidisarcina polymorpha]
MPFTDKEMEVQIGHMLRIGVTLAAVVVGAGGVLYLRSETAAPDFVHFHATADHLRTVSGVLHGVQRLDPASIIQLGVLLLVATPVVRVMLCVIGFARQRDRLYVGVSALVLLILTYSLL